MLLRNKDHFTLTSIQYLILWMLLVNSKLLIAQENNRAVIGHSHNDYEQVNPLFDALDNGFTSIEVDVFYFHNQLVVSHDTLDLDQKPTLEQLYLDRIDSLLGISTNLKKWMDQPITLMIDLKTNDEETLRALENTLAPYDHLLQKRIDGKTQKGPVRILISGNPPIEAWLTVDSPYFYLDGRLGTKYPAQMKEQILRISAPLNRVISKGDLMSYNSAAYIRLKGLVANLYKLGYEEVRFWATPNTPKAWKALMNAGVNVISVDNLQKFNAQR